jgi:hypothetical protein
MAPNAKIKAMWARYVQAKEEKMTNETEYAELIKWLEMLQIPVGYSGDLSTASRSREPLRAANAIRTLLAREERLREALKLAEEALAKHTSAASAGNGPSQKAYDALLAVRAALGGEPQ